MQIKISLTVLVRKFFLPILLLPHVIMDYIMD